MMLKIRYLYFKLKVNLRENLENIFLKILRQAALQIRSFFQKYLYLLHIIYS